MEKIKNRLIPVITVLVIIIIAVTLYFIFKNTVATKKQFGSSEGITVVLTMNDELKEDTIWCGTFQLIWNDLKNDIAKQNIIFTNHTSLTENLNLGDFDTSKISEDAYYKKVGIPSQDLKREIEKEINENFLHIGIVSSIALVLHNLIEGMAIYSTMKTSFDMGILVTIGVGLHNIPMGMIVSSTFYKANKNLKKTVLFTSLIALSTFLGGLIMFALSSYITNLLLGILLCITLGMIIYIVVFELLSEILHNKNKKESFIGIAFGILIFILSSFFE